jgi:hypothetical protein
VEPLALSLVERTVCAVHTSLHPCPSWTQQHLGCIVNLCRPCDGASVNLLGYQLRVHAPLCEELVVRALLRDPPSAYDQDLVGISHRAEAVRYD